MSEPGPTDQLTDRQERAVVALLTRPSATAAAREVGVSESTLRLWLAQPAFRGAVRAARRALVDEAVLALQRLVLDAVATLARNLKAKGNPAAQVRAAVAILDRAIAAQELIDMRAELEEMRAAVEKMREDGGGDRTAAGLPSSQAD